MELLNIFAVWKTDHPDTLCVEIEQKIAEEPEPTRDYYILVEGDEFGLAPIIRRKLSDLHLPVGEWENCPINMVKMPRSSYPHLSMVDFRRKLRSIKVVQRYYPDGTPYEELEGIYEEDILEKIDLIADKDLQAEARDYFLYAQYVERTNPWIEILGDMFGITPEQIDIFWMS